MKGWCAGIILLLAATSGHAEGFRDDPSGDTGARTMPAPIGITDTPCPPQAPVSADERRLVDWLLATNSDPKAMVPLMMTPGMAARAKTEKEQRAKDWPDLCKYQAANADLAHGARPQVVFMGDSITEFWGFADPELFSNGRVDRGISGQTSPQMVLRFMADVVALRPSVVHLLAGTNDVAGNTGPTRPEDYENNIRAMVTLAKANKIAVVLCAITPSRNPSWRPGHVSPEKIRDLNAWLRRYAREEHLVFLDYGAFLADRNGEMKPEFSNDGVHPNSVAYARMRPLAEAAIAQALRKAQAGLAHP